MLKKTFLHIPGIGEKREKILWKKGIHNWEDIINNNNDLSFFSKELEIKLKDYTEISLNKLRNKDFTFFEKYIPQKYHWRAFKEFCEEAVYLDIETTYINNPNNQQTITIVGALKNNKYNVFIKGKNLDDLPYFLNKTKLLITFYGSAFDIPTILKEFPLLRINALHIDLCFTLKQIGYKGGLKSIEKQLNIFRTDDINNLSGYDAPILWEKYKRGNEHALQTLIKYNQADVCNLQPLMEIAYEKLCEKEMDEDIN